MVCMHFFRFCFPLVLVILLTVPTFSESPFAIRGTLPWHNFLSGPTAWDFEDYKEYLDWMADLGLNFVGFHCYTGGAERYVNYVEPLIRVEYRRVLPLAEFDTSITARWGYSQLTTDRYAFGTSKLFPHKVFGSDAAIRARSNSDRYDRAQDLMQKAIAYAHKKGIKVCIGFEFGVYPPEFYSILPPGAMLPSPYLPDPTHSANIEILRLYIRNIKEAYPELDYVWFWLQEMNNPTGQIHFSPKFQRYFDEHKQHFADLNDPLKITNGVWSLAYIEKAREMLQEEMPAAKIAISGWGGDSQLPPLLKGLNEALPNDVIFSCLNPSQGWKAQEPIMAQMPNREVWIIPWLEGDQRLWHPQPRVSLLEEHIAQAQREGIEGVIGIHWRTQDIAINFAALGELTNTPISSAESHPYTHKFYRQWCEDLYGDESASVLMSLLLQMDEQQILAPESGGNSPEYYAYDPYWGRLDEKTHAFIEELLEKVEERLELETVRNYGKNLQYLSDTLKTVLYLDEVGRHVQPAYELKQAILEERITKENSPSACEDALQELQHESIPLLFQTYKKRVHSRGELGVLSAMNQKLWTTVEDLRFFLEEQMERNE